MSSNNNEIEVLKKQNDDFKKENEELKKQIEVIKNENEELKQRVFILQKENDELKKGNEKLPRNDITINDFNNLSLQQQQLAISSISENQTCIKISELLLYLLRFKQPGINSVFKIILNNNEEKLSDITDLYQIHI